jgi:Spy/CpxP family protein refolding chaperone
MNPSRLVFSSMLLVAVALSAPSAFAQDQGQGNRQQGERRQRGQGNANNNGGRGNFDPAQFRDRMYARYKEQLGSNDEEWKVIQPKLEKVLATQRDGRSSRGGDFGGRGGRPGGDRNAADQNQSAVARASAELRAAIEDKSSSADAITAKVTALREAREKAKADIAAAQKELRELLTARQEAVLISGGILD